MAVGMLVAGCGGGERSASRAAYPLPSHTPIARVLEAKLELELVATHDRSDATVPSGLYSSTDGVHWRDITPPVSTTLTSDAIEFVSGSFVDPNTGWVAACNLGDYRMTNYMTSDGGTTWRQSTGGGDHCEESIQTLSADVAVVDTPVRCAACQVLAKTSDGGATWQDVFTTTEGGSPGPGRTPVVFADEHDAFSASLIGDLAERNGWPAGYFAVSHDGGRTWDRQAPPAAGGSPAQYALPVFSDPDHGVLGTLGGTDENMTVGFDVTSDGGRTWQQQASRPTAVQPAEKWPVFGRYPNIAVASATTWWLLTPTSPVRVEVTTDAGRQWTSLLAAGLPGPPDYVHAVDDSHAWATVTTVGAEAADNYKVEVYATSDGGKQWSPVVMPPRR
jgi:photosystem II stability/assembly factor-like uncharacterized protein